MRARFQRGTVLSTLIHVALLLVLVLLLDRHAEVMVHARMPGRLSGQVIALTYSEAGAPVHAKAPPRPQAAARRTLKGTSRSPLAAPPRQAHTAPAAGQPGDAALGDGDMTLALEQVFPTPHPDLSSLPHGAAGDVIVDVVIDAGGKIAKVTLMQGMGDAIDRDVIATVQQWQFSPAMQDGRAIASEQELLFHYERG